MKPILGWENVLDKNRRDHTERESLIFNNIKKDVPQLFLGMNEVKTS